MAKVKQDGKVDVVLRTTAELRDLWTADAAELEIPLGRLVVRAALHGWPAARAELAERLEEHRAFEAKWEDDEKPVDEQKGRFREHRARQSSARPAEAPAPVRAGEPTAVSRPAAGGKGRQQEGKVAPGDAGRPAGDPSTGAGEKASVTKNVPAAAT